MCSRQCFVRWKPLGLPWIPRETDWKKTNWNCTSVYREMYKKDPEKGENVYCMNKAGAVLNSVLGMYPLPTNLTQSDWQYLLRAENLMSQSDMSISQGLSTTMTRIGNVNPQLFEKQTKIEEEKEVVRNCNGDKCDIFEYLNIQAFI